jgi:NADH-quinone oxidoreductase subunit H
MLADWLSNPFVFSAVLALGVIGVMLGSVAYCIYFERKIAAWIQDRYGPNRVGPRGLLQPIADGAKFLLKEDIIPDHVDKPLYLFAPALIFIVALVGFAVIPWGGHVRIGAALMNVQVANPDIGLLYVLGVGSMGVYGLVLGGYASNNKYSFLGAMRACAQMLSYEVPMGLVILAVVLTTGQLRLEEILLAQVGPGNVWNVVRHPLAAGILLITLFAEANRTPFDLSEAEQELVGGYHTEYSAMKFALFFLAEYAHMITGSAFLVVLFLGGWHLPWVPGLQPGDTSLGALLLKLAVMGAKIACLLFVFMWVRWTLPRFRFDQLMRLAWKGLVPMGLGLVTVAAMVVYLGRPLAWEWTLAGNAVVLLVALAVTALTPERVSGRQHDMPELSVPARGGGARG